MKKNKKDKAAQAVTRDKKTAKEVQSFKEVEQKAPSLTHNPFAEMLKPRVAPAE